MLSQLYLPPRPSTPVIRPGLRDLAYLKEVYKTYGLESSFFYDFTLNEKIKNAQEVLDNLLKHQDILKRKDIPYAKTTLYTLKATLAKRVTEQKKTGNEPEYKLREVQHVFYKDEAENRMYPVALYSYAYNTGHPDTIYYRGKVGTTFEEVGLTCSTPGRPMLHIYATEGKKLVQ